MALTKATLIDLNSNELILDLDADTSITADTDDTIHIKIAGSDELTLTNTAIAPSTSDGQALGTSSLMFSDLFLASGSVVNFNNGDVTLTHGSNTLVLDGGSLDLNAQELILDADADTSITADTDDTIHFRIGGSDLITFTAGRIDLKNAGTRSNIKFYCESGNAHAQTLQAAPHSESASNTLTLPSTGGDVDLVSTASTATLTNKTLTTPKIAEIDSLSSGDITLDAEADIVLDAAGGNIEFKDAGTLQLTIDMDGTAGAQVVQLGVDSDDLIFKQYDGTTVLTLDDDTTVKVATDLTVGDDVSLISDSAVLNFGANSEIKLTHVHDSGLALKHTATADDKPITLVLQTGETDIAQDDVIGKIDFQAPDEGTGTDAILVAAGIAAVSEGDFSATNNATKLSFRTAASEAASEKMSLSSAGLLTVSDDIVFKDGGTIGVSSAVDAMTVASSGEVTFKDDIRIKDGGTIGTASDGDSITIAAAGGVTFSQAATITVGDNSDTLTLKSTDDDASSGPILNLVRDSASPADADSLGRILFSGDNDAGESENFVRFKAAAVDVSNGSEDGQLRISRMSSGGDYNMISLLDGENVINDDGRNLTFRVEEDGNANGLYLDGGNGAFYIGTDSGSINDVGTKIFGTSDSTNKGGINVVTAGGNNPLALNRSNGDGDFIQFKESNSLEGSIAVSGSTVSYNTFTGTHWTRLADNSKPTILKGTVMETLNTMINWYNIEFNDSDGILQVIPHILQDGQSHGDTITYDHNGTDFTATIKKEDDIKHVQTKISDTSESKSVYGVFHDWDTEEANGGTVNDMMIAAVGTYVVRVNKDITVSAGDLLVSNGDGTAKVQDDDIIRSKTIAKVNSNIKVETYSDGSYTVPCTLHCG